jgi:hypothetical protein
VKLSWIFISLILAPQLATAAGENAGSYQFATSCGSQGPWTQQALQKTSELRSILTKLKDQADCKAFGTQMQASLDRMQQQLSSVDQNRQQAQTATQLPGQVDALRSSLATDSPNRGSVLNAMFSRMLDSARTLQPELRIASSITGIGDTQAATAMGRSTDSSLLNQISTASSASLQIFNDTIDILPQVQNCLINPNLTGQLVGASVQVLSALAGGGQSQNSLSLARAISKLSNYLREAPFAKALNTLNKNDFMASLACLLEMTSENYCATRDAHILFDQLTNDDEVETSASGELRLKPNSELFVGANSQQSPLAGYYLLTQNVPMITDWLQMIQLGAEPRLSTDADQKNMPINQIAAFQTTTNSLKAKINSQVENIRNYTTIEEKQNAVYSMAVDLYTTLGTTQQTTNGVVLQNFFTLALQPVDMIFYLIGIPTPDAVRPTSGQMQAPDAWLQNNYKNLPIFNDPIALSNTIAANLSKIIEQANRSSITYYNKWFIVDKVLITNRALFGINYSVKDALKNTRNYLDNFAGRVRKYSPADLSMVPLIIETRDRIDKVLARFSDLEALGRSAADGTTSAADSDDQAMKLSETLIAEVYNQFYVMLGKSGWLSSRMADFVTADFQMMRRAGVGLDPYLDEIYAASGRMLGDEIVRISGNSPAAVKTDLSMALYLGKGNLEAIDVSLGESYVNQIALLQQIVDGHHFTDATLLWQAKHPEENRVVPQVEHYPDQNPITESSAAQVISGFYRSYLKSFGDIGRMFQKADNIATDAIQGQTPLSPDDEFGSAKNLQAQLCVQSLAFTNISAFWNLCKKTKLLSPYASTPIAADKKVQFNARYNVDYQKKAWQDYKEKGREANLSTRICAFRDFNRRNFILYLTKNSK